MSDASEDGNVLWQTDVNRFREVLNEEKDLSKNFEKDVIKALEILSRECAIDEDDQSLINFTLAGMVINGSSNVYGRKVDYVHDLTLILQDHLLAQTNQVDDDNGPNKRRKKDFEFVEVFNSEEDQATLDWSLDKSARKKVKPMLTSLPLALLPLRDNENDSPLVSVTGEVIGQRMDLCLNRFCANRTDIVLCHRYLKEGQSDEDENSFMPNGGDNDSYSDDDNDDNPPPTDFPLASPDAIPFANDIPNLNLSEAEMVTDNVPNPPENECEASCPPQKLTKIMEKKADEPKPKRKCLELALMDPYEVKTSNERTASLRCRVLPRLTQSMSFSPVKKVRTVKRRYSSSSDEAGAAATVKDIKPEPFWEFFEKMRVSGNVVPKKGLKDPPYFESLNELAYKETLERRRINAKDKVNDLREYCDDVQDEEGEFHDNYTRSSEGSDEEMPPFQLNDHEGNDVHVNGPSPLPPFQTNEEACHNVASAIASDLKDLYEKASNFERSTDLLERVGTWNRHINPILEKERQRRNFNAKEYQEDILKSFSDKNVIPFREVVNPKEDFEVARYFVSALSLVNDGKIEFLSTSPEKVANHVEIGLI